MVSKILHNALYPAFGVLVIGYYVVAAIQHEPEARASYGAHAKTKESKIKKRYLKKSKYRDADITWRHRFKGANLTPPPPPAPPSPQSYSSGSYSSGSYSSGSYSSGSYSSGSYSSGSYSSGSYSSGSYGK